MRLTAEGVCFDANNASYRNCVGLLMMLTSKRRQRHKTSVINSPQAVLDAGYCYGRCYIDVSLSVCYGPEPCRNG